MPYVSYMHADVHIRVFEGLEMQANYHLNLLVACIKHFPPQEDQSTIKSHIIANVVFSIIPDLYVYMSWMKKVPWHKSKDFLVCVCACTVFLNFSCSSIPGSLCSLQTYFALSDWSHCACELYLNDCWFAGPVSSKSCVDGIRHTKFLCLGYFRLSYKDSAKLFHLKCHNTLHGHVAIQTYCRLCRLWLLTNLIRAVDYSSGKFWLWWSIESMLTD